MVVPVRPLGGSTRSGPEVARLETLSEDQGVWFDMKLGKIHMLSKLALVPVQGPGFCWKTRLLSEDAPTICLVVVLVIALVILPGCLQLGASLATR